MDLAGMEAKFQERTSGLGASLSPTEIDAYLNRWYQYNIPATVGRDMMEGVWTLECQNLVAEYDYPPYVVAPRSRDVWIKQKKTDFDNDPTLIDAGGPFWINVQTDRALFTALDEEYPESPTGGIPTSMLLSDRKATLSPLPNEGFLIVIPSRTGPSALEPEGIANEVHALAVVTGAAHEFLNDKEDNQGALVQAGSHDYYIDKLRTFSIAKPRHRRPNRSF